jgi:hypothetical protein
VSRFVADHEAHALAYTYAQRPRKETPGPDTEGREERILMIAMGGTLLGYSIVFCLIFLLFVCTFVLRLYFLFLIERTFS